MIGNFIFRVMLNTVLTLFDPDDFDDPYWFHASIFFEDGCIYLVRDYARNKSEIDGSWYIKAKKLKYKTIKNNT